MGSWDVLSVKQMSKTVEGKNYYLGVDTSNYRTSICLLDEMGRIVFERRPLLVVPQGKLGLRQQEAVFQHLKTLPELFEELGVLKGEIHFGVTNKPRNLQESYMPCFLVGESFIRALSAGRGYLAISHQENHIWAGLKENEELIGKPFLAVHLSGGTTEFLKVNWSKSGYNLSVDEIGGTSDISAGQFLDRIGVLLGLPFPSGPYLEELAERTDLRIGVQVKGNKISYSGPETKAKQLILEGTEGKHIAYAALLAISKSVSRVIHNIVIETGIEDVLLVGGVMANKLIKERLILDLSKTTNLYFASENASGDSALGVATALLNSSRKGGN